MGIILVIVMIATLGVSATVFAAPPTAGGTVTFDDGDLGGTTYVEDGITVMGHPSDTSTGNLSVGNFDADADAELNLSENNGSNARTVTVDMGGSEFDLISIVLAVNSGSRIEISTVPASSPDPIVVNTLGVTTLNLLAITSVIINGFGSAAIDDIVINVASTKGGKSKDVGNNDGNNGKKADRMDVCHGDREIGINGNAEDAHIAHGDGC